MKPAPRSKTLATWLGVVGGSFGLDIEVPDIRS